MWRLLSCVALALFAVSFHTTGVSAAYDGLKLDGIFDDFEAKLNLEDLNIAERYQITGFGDLARLSPLSQELLSKAQRTLIIRKKPEVEYEGAESLEGESTAEDEGFVSAAVHPKNSTDEEVVAMQADEPAKQAATEKRGHGARRRRGKCTDIIDPNENPLLKPFADAIGEVKKFLLLDTYVVECVSQEAAIAMALKLQKVDEVEDVSFDDLVMSQQQTWSNDPYLSNAGQYNVLNTDSRYDIGVGRAVGVARDRVSKTSNLDSLRDEPVLVSVPDSGIDLFHPDLKNMIWSNSGEIPNNGKDDDENGYIDDVNGYDFVNDGPVPNDDFGHGTHCSGIVAAETNNGEGIASVGGVGGSDWVRLLPLKVLNDQGVGKVSSVIEAINYSKAMGASVLSASFDGAPDSPALKEAISGYTGNDEGLFVVAAGNSNRDTSTSPSYPGSYADTNDAVISVANVESNGIRNRLSNYGGCTVSAPGSSILSTVPGSDYDLKTGTSQAAPLVAGILATAAYVFPDQPLSALRDCVIDSSISLPETICNTGGQVSFSGTMECVLKKVNENSNAEVEDPAVDRSPFSSVLPGGPSTPSTGGGSGGGGGSGDGGGFVFGGLPTLDFDFLSGFGNIFQAFG